MKFWIGGEVALDVSDAFRHSRKLVENELKSQLGSIDFGQGVIELAFVGIILPENHRDTFREVQRYSKRERMFEFRLHIDHKQFQCGDSNVQARLICAAMLRAIDMIDNLKVPDVDSKAIRDRFLVAIQAKGWGD